jgi:hypothetical protein
MGVYHVQSVILVQACNQFIQIIQSIYNDRGRLANTQDLTEERQGVWWEGLNIK